MSNDDTTADESTDPDERDVRALEQYLTVLPEAPGLFQVVSQSGKAYTVDAEAGVCECPDYEYREPVGGCKHVRRVAFATGARPIPDGVDPATVDEQLGIHVEGATPQADGGPVAVPDGGILEADDDGEVLDEREPEPEYTYHVEPPEQGGERYVRCEGCGAELLTSLGGTENLIHREGCPRGEGR